MQPKQKVLFRSSAITRFPNVWFASCLIIVRMIKYAVTVKVSFKGNIAKS